MIDAVPAAVMLTSLAVGLAAGAGSSPGEVAYEARLPTATRTDRISRSITALREPAPAINWEKK